MPLTFEQLEEYLTSYIECRLEPQIAAGHIIDYLIYEPPLSTLNEASQSPHTGGNAARKELIAPMSIPRNTISRKKAVEEVGQMLLNLKLLSNVSNNDPVVCQCYNKLSRELPRAFQLHPELIEEFRTYDNLSEELQLIVWARPLNEAIDAKRVQKGRSNNSQFGSDKLLLEVRNDPRLQLQLSNASFQGDSMALFESLVYQGETKDFKSFDPTTALSTGFVRQLEQADSPESLMRKLPLIAQECIPDERFSDRSAALTQLGTQCRVRGIVSRLFDKKSDRYKAVIASTGTEMALVWDPEKQTLTQVRTPYYVKQGDEWVGNSLYFQDPLESLRIATVPVKPGSFIFLLTESAWKQLECSTKDKRGIRYIDVDSEPIVEKFKALQVAKPNAGLKDYQERLQEIVCQPAEKERKVWAEVISRIDKEIKAKAHTDKNTLGEFDFLADNDRPDALRRHQFHLDIAKYILFRSKQGNCPQAFHDAVKAKNYSTITTQLLKEDLEKFYLNNDAAVVVQWAEPKKFRYVRKFIETNDNSYLTKAYHAGLATQDLEGIFSTLANDNRYNQPQLKQALKDVTLFLDVKYQNTLSFTALALTILSWVLIGPIFLTPMIYGIFKRNLNLTPDTREIVETTESEYNQVKTLREQLESKRKAPETELNLFNKRRKLRKFLLKEETSVHTDNVLSIESEPQVDSEPRAESGSSVEPVNIQSRTRARKNLFFSMSQCQKDEYELLRSAIRQKQAGANVVLEQVVTRFTPSEKADLKARLRAIHYGP